MDILIVGAGLSGAVLARELARKGFKILVIEKRSHIAGNAFDFVNDYGIRVHQYGPHIFHTSNIKVVDWLSEFTDWIPYKHKVKAQLESGQYVTLPPNIETTEILGMQGVVETLFRPYTKKMWGLDIEDLDPSILSRVPIRNDLNQYYFPNDTFQALPKNGYSEMVGRILDHPNIQVSLNTTFSRGMQKDFFHTFNSMPIDEYFDFDLGELPYRSIQFHTYTLPIPRLLPVACVNFTHDGPFTRVTEWKHFPNSVDNSHYTTITVEEPCDYKENNYERYYPVKDVLLKNRAIYNIYASRCPADVSFIGRCGLYAYLDMHQAVSSSLAIAKGFNLTK